MAAASFRGPAENQHDFSLLSLYPGAYAVRMDGELHITRAAERLGVGANYLRRLERQRRIPAARRDRFGDRIYNELDLQLLRTLGVGSGRRLRRPEDIFAGAR